ncbi:transposase [Chitinophaga sp. Ak27]|uniref:transposase n=1 Tax=Chitinophaga sp. Ak27 TaxID=2726116 RepID=UPI001B7CEF59|nr:transposase [Chitinophaga sp. Ak27]
MKTEDFLSDDFLKHFKTADQLNNFLAQIQKRGIEKMLEGELDSHLGYDKHEPNKSDNSRNRYSKKKIKTSYGESEITVPGDRDASFNPMIVPNGLEWSRGRKR